MSIPLTAYGKASACSVLFSLTSRQFTANFVWRRLAVRLGLLPLFCLLMYSFMMPSLDETQNSFQTRSSIIFNLLAAITFLMPVITTNYCKYNNILDRFWNQKKTKIFFQNSWTASKPILWRFISPVNLPWSIAYININTGQLTIVGDEHWHCGQHHLLVDTISGGWILDWTMDHLLCCSLGSGYFCGTGKDCLVMM